MLIANLAVVKKKLKIILGWYEDFVHVRYDQSMAFLSDIR
jgi:hypothetical protein